MNIYNKRSEINDLPCPTSADLLKLNAKGIEGLAYSLSKNVEVDKYDDFGQLTLELTMLMLMQISSKMTPNQTLEDILG